MAAMARSVMQPQTRQADLLQTFRKILVGGRQQEQSDSMMERLFAVALSRIPDSAIMYLAWRDRFATPGSSTEYFNCIQLADLGGHVFACGVAPDGRAYFAFPYRVEKVVDRSTTEEGVSIVFQRYCGNGDALLHTTGFEFFSVDAREYERIRNLLEGQEVREKWPDDDGTVEVLTFWDRSVRPSTVPPHCSRGTSDPLCLVLLPPPSAPSEEGGASSAEAAAGAFSFVPGPEAANPMSPALSPAPARSVLGPEAEEAAGSASPGAAGSPMPASPVFGILTPEPLGF